MKTTLPPSSLALEALAEEITIHSVTRPAPATCEALASTDVDQGWDCGVDFGAATVILDGDVEWLDVDLEEV